MPYNPDLINLYNIGTDISIEEKVQKYSKPLDPKLAGQRKGSFPDHLIPKTDEPNFQGCGRMIDALKVKPWYATVKADGSSGTVYKLNGELHGCTRNLELNRDETSAVWHLVKKYDLENIIPEGYAIQFEMVGPKIQKNPMKLTELEMRVFNLYQLRTEDNPGRYLGFAELSNFCSVAGLPMVEVVYEGDSFNFTKEQLQKMAEGEYYPGKQREGIVIRPKIEEYVNQSRLSFKVINLLYKD